MDPGTPRIITLPSREGRKTPVFRGGGPPPHQPSPAGSVSATPPRGGSEWTPERPASSPSPRGRVERRQSFGEGAPHRINRRLPARFLRLPLEGGVSGPRNAPHHHPPLEGGSKDASLSGRGPPTASTVACRLGFCDSPSRGE